MDAVEKTERLLLNAKFERYFGAAQSHAEIFPHIPVEYNRTSGLQAMLASLPPLYTVVEVGSFAGVSTEVFALLVDNVIAVDMWEGADFEHAWPLFKQRMATYNNVRALRMSSVEAAQTIADSSVDLVYIDADHTYTSVMQDIQTWKAKVCTGGWLTGHDYCAQLPDVVRAVNDNFGKPDRVFSDSSWLVQVKR